MTLVFNTMTASAQSSEESVDVADDELRGVVLSVNEEANTLVIRPLEVGRNLRISTGSPVTLEVNASTVIRDDVYATQLDGLENVHENDMVLLDLATEAGGRLVARQLTRHQENQSSRLAQAGRLQELPATASVLPMLALAGFTCWGLALMLRIGRT